MIPVITLDGPSGSGKGTVGQLLAQQLGWHFLDSGAVYRLLALAMLKHKIGLTTISSVENLAANLSIKFINSNRVFLENEEVTEEIRTEKCGLVASKIATQPHVRAALMQLQRSFQKPPGLVADGRDMGTVVFPGADLKIFITATCEERALRRYKQLQDKGINVSLHHVLEELELRDKRDVDREVAPLKPATDAVIVDTTKLSIDEVVQKIARMVRNKGL